MITQFFKKIITLNLFSVRPAVSDIVKTSISATKQLGNRGEQAVAHYLVQRGFTILVRNYRQRYGEIDIIAQKNDIIAFVEVKTRRTAPFDTGQVITHNKQRKIIMTAKQYLTSIPEEVVGRFDVALLEYADESPHITYIENAFC